MEPAAASGAASAAEPTNDNQADDYAVIPPETEWRPFMLAVDKLRRRVAVHTALARTLWRPGDAWMAQCLVVDDLGELRPFVIEVDTLEKAWPKKDSLIPLRHCQSLWQVTDADAAKRLLTVALRKRVSQCVCASCTPLKAGAIKHYWK